MRKKSTPPSIVTLCLTLLLLATPPALWNRASAGSFPGIMYYTGPALATITPSPAHTITPSPVHPGSLAPRPSERRTLTCNRPATDPPPISNGCTEYEPVAPPDEPIPPPCIVSARYHETEEYGEPLIQLQIKVDHPELCDNCRGTIELTRYGYGLGTWDLSDIRADASCAKDEAPLAWATLQILNTEQLDALDIYTAPLPSFYLDLLAELGGRQNSDPITLGSSSRRRIETYRPPNAFQVTWYANAERLDVDVYPDGGWQLAPDCYDWPASCWDIVGDRWGFRVARDNAGEWELVATSGDYTPGHHGMEQALVDATLATLRTGDLTLFAVFEPVFDGCYVRLLLALREQELPASGVWPQAPS